jgi:hypothetical protein
VQRGFFMSETIEFFPIIQGLEKIEPIVPAREINKNATFEKEEFSLKSCPGIRDLTHCGYVIPLWQDIRIRFDDNQGITVVPSGSMLDQKGIPFHDVQFHDERTMAGYSFGKETVTGEKYKKFPDVSERTNPFTNLLKKYNLGNRVKIQYPSKIASKFSSLQILNPGNSKQNNLILKMSMYKS